LYIEFHHLLIELLMRFENSLAELAKARGNAKDPTRGSEEFKPKVELVMLCGYALQRLAEGAALRMHLKTIAPFLKSWNIHTRTSMSKSAPDEEQEELDEDLKAIQPFVGKEGSETSLWQSYVDWFQGEGDGPATHS